MRERAMIFLSTQARPPEIVILSGMVGAPVPPMRSVGKTSFFAGNRGVAVLVTPYTDGPITHEIAHINGPLSQRLSAL